MNHLKRSSFLVAGMLITWGTLSNGCALNPYGTGENVTSSSGSGTAGAGGEGGMGGAGGAGGTGGAISCQPGSTESCYSGPMKTAGKGICKTGQHTCLPSGTEWGPCLGEVTPSLENCVVLGDEDCDELSDLEDSECKCTTPSTAAPCKVPGKLGVCADGMGLCNEDGREVLNCVPVNVPSPETCVTPVDDDCDGITAPSCVGEPQWTFVPNPPTSTTKDDVIFSVAKDPGGGYVIAGMVDGYLGGDGYGISSGSIYVAKLDSVGALQWEKRFTPTISGTARGVALDSIGNIYVAGEFAGIVKFDGTNDVTSAGFSTDIFMLKLDPKGQHIWNRRFGAGNTQVATDIAIDTDNNVYITGYAISDIFSFGGIELDPDNVDVFLAKYDTDSNHQWSRMYRNPGPQGGRSIRLTSGGDVVIAGDTDNNVNFSGSTPLTNKGGRDFFVGRFSKNDGSHQWSKIFGNGNDQSVRAVELAPDGHLLITGGFAGSISWNAMKTVNAVGVSDVYVAKLNVETGEHMQDFAAGKTLTTVGTTVGSDVNGNITVFGHFNGTMDFGGQTYASTPGTYDAFLVKLKFGDWSPIWTNTYGKGGNQFGLGLTVNSDGSCLTAGGFFTEFEVAPNPIITSTGGYDIFAVLVNP